MKESKENALIKLMEITTIILISIMIIRGCTL